MASSSASALSTLSNEIDQSLEQYLGLLDQYTSLRSQVITIQASIHQNIARANFNADRGIRYGSDLYDARMQAVRLCRITIDSGEGFEEVAGKESTAAFTVSKIANSQEAQAEEVSGESNEQVQPLSEVTNTVESQLPSENQSEQEPEKRKEKKEETIDVSKDPLRMFGILVPQALRVAQSESITLVEEYVSKLATLDACLKELEIKIRRARKYKSKAEAEEFKKLDRDMATQSLEARLDQSIVLSEALSKAIEERAILTEKLELVNTVEQHVIIADELMENTRLQFVLSSEIASLTPSVPNSTKFKALQKQWRNDTQKIMKHGLYKQIHEMKQSSREKMWQYHQAAILCDKFRLMDELCHDNCKILELWELYAQLDWPGEANRAQLRSITRSQRRAASLVDSCLMMRGLLQNRMRERAELSSNDAIPQLLRACLPPAFIGLWFSAAAYMWWLRSSA